MESMKSDRFIQAKQSETRQTKIHQIPWGFAETSRFLLVAAHIRGSQQVTINAISKPTSVLGCNHSASATLALSDLSAPRVHPIIQSMLRKSQSFLHLFLHLFLLCRFHKTVLSDTQSNITPIYIITTSARTSWLGLHSDNWKIPPTGTWSLKCHSAGIDLSIVASYCSTVRGARTATGLRVLQV